MTLPSIVDLLGRHRDKGFASIEDGTGAVNTVTYAEELSRVRRAVCTLHDLGVTAGDRVHVQLRNRLEFYDLWFAASAMGAALVPTNPQSSIDELSYVMADSSPELSIVEPEQVEHARQAAGNVSVLPVSGGSDSWTERMHRADEAELAPGDVTRTVGILYTSGTTSRPKGVMVTGANYATVGQAVAAHLDIQTRDRWLIVLPLFHANAQYYCAMSALVAGASVAVVPRFSASQWAQQALKHGATLGSLFAAPIRMILASSAPKTATGLRAVLFAQNVTDEQAREFEESFNTRLLQLYGMTETVVPPTMNPNSEQRRWSSIGRPLGPVGIRLVDEAGAEVPDGQPGEIVVRGRLGTELAAGYLGQQTATERTFDGGALRTGDLAIRDPDGFYYFVDRGKDMIKRSGENVAASEVERVVNEHPAVFESAAVGAPDPVKDEQIVLYAVLRPGAEASETELTAWCAERLAPFKVPSTFVFIDALPRTSVGKIRKTDLRATVVREAASTTPPSAPPHASR